MDSRVALIGIMVEKENSVEELNKLLHQYSGYIVGRMGIPYHKRGVNIISVVTVSYTHLTLPTIYSV